MARTDKGARIKVGDIYQDCAYHPVLCTEADGDGLSGISLLDGSGPRSCSRHNCGPRKMTPEQVARRIQNRDRWLAAEKAFHEDWSNRALYDKLLAEENQGRAE